MQMPFISRSLAPFAVLAFTATTLLGACSKPAEVTAPPGPAAAGVPTEWLGKWNGPEGTYLDIAAAPDDQYKVTIANLDGPRTFTAAATEGGLSFERDGARETLHASDGAATGMKWLADKKTCLTVKPGEGYCRD